MARDSIVKSLLLAALRGGKINIRALLKNSIIAQYEHFSPGHAGRLFSFDSEVTYQVFIQKFGDTNA